MPENNAPAPAGRMKKWYVIGGIVVLLIIAAWLSLRSVPWAMLNEEGVESSTGPNGEMTYSDKDGNSVTVGATTMPSNWPSDAPQNYAGATISYAGSSNPQTGKPGSAVVYSVHASVQEVVDYYKQQLEGSGWTIVSTANMGKATVLSATKDTRGLGVYVVSDGSGGVSVTVGVGNQ